ncbi:MAG: hypothetical protein WAM91_02920 [Candidatus Acidiferrales bacterium]
MAKQRPTGKCKLCGEVKLLCDSHYMPKRIYAFLAARQLKNPNPVMDGRGGLRQISDQYRGYVFCQKCEDLLNKNGEKWVLANIPKGYDAPFPLQDALAPLNPVIIGNDCNVYDVSVTKAFDVKKLVYFGISVFWRGAVHCWKTSTGQEAPTVDLAEYETQMREFILGIGPFPSNVILTIDIWPYKKVLQAMQPVTTANLQACGRLWFYVPGLTYSLYVGPNLSAGIKAINAVRGIVKVDLVTGKSVYDYVTIPLKNGVENPKMKDLAQEIAFVRSHLTKQ